MTTMTTKEAAELLGTDPRTLRKFLRAQVVEAGGKVGEDTPGKGKRYSLEADELPLLQERFDLWIEAKTQADEEVEVTEVTEAEIGA